MRGPLPARRSVGALFDRFRVGAGREFDDAEGTCLNIEDGQVGDYAVHEGLTDERKGAFVDQPGTAVFDGVFHDADDPLRAVNEVLAPPARAVASDRLRRSRPGQRLHGYGACEDAGQSRIVTVTSKLELASLWARGGGR